MQYKEKARPIGKPQVKEPLSAQEESDYNQKMADWYGFKKDRLIKEINAICADIQKSLVEPQWLCYFSCKRGEYNSMSAQDKLLLPQERKAEMDKLNAIWDKIGLNEQNRLRLIEAVSKDEVVDVKSGWVTY